MMSVWYGTQQNVIFLLLMLDSMDCIQESRHLPLSKAFKYENYTAVAIAALLLQKIYCIVIEVCAQSLILTKQCAKTNVRATFRAVCMDFIECPILFILQTSHNSISLNFSLPIFEFVTNSPVDWWWLGIPRSTSDTAEFLDWWNHRASNFSVSKISSLRCWNSPGKLNVKTTSFHKIYSFWDFPGQHDILYISV